MVCSTFLRVQFKEAKGELIHFHISTENVQIPFLLITSETSTGNSSAWAIFNKAHPTQMYCSASNEDQTTNLAGDNCQAFRSAPGWDATGSHSQQT